MNYPTREQCLKWYRDIGTPENILDHVALVNKVAVFLAKKLKEKGVKINIELVDKASLLHDLDKWFCINDKSVRHGFKTEEILTEKGYSELGFYAKQHNSIQSKTWEEKVISYSDARVLFTKIVPVQDRIDSSKKRYKREEGFWDKALESLLEKEKIIFSKLAIKPDKLAEYFEK
ncbi:MAG: hypothetical protein AABW92_02425 [Nanoarchaeota archaeon]